MADTVIEAHQLLHPFLGARQCPAGARRSASSVASAFVVGAQPQPRRLPVTSHPSWPCPAARACGLPAADRAGPPRAWGASGPPWPGLRQAGRGWADAVGWDGVKWLYFAYTPTVWPVRRAFTHAVARGMMV